MSCSVVSIFLYANIFPKKLPVSSCNFFCPVIVFVTSPLLFFVTILCIYFCCPYFTSHLRSIFPGHSPFMSNSCLALTEVPFARCSSIFSSIDSFSVRFLISSLCSSWLRFTACSSSFRVFICFSVSFWSYFLCLCTAIDYLIIRNFSM